MILHLSSIVLFLALFIDVSFANDGNSRITLRKRGHLPPYQPTASNSQHSSSHSSYRATFTPVVPKASNNKYIYHNSQKDGTVFIAVGSCIGFIILASFGIWLFFAIRAWKSARQEYKIRALENKYQYDPFYFTGTPEVYDNATDFSDTDDSSDISEKVFKTKASRVSMYSLGSNSALNLLNQAQPSHASETAADSNAALANASNMFISPTEMLKSKNNNRATRSLVHPSHLEPENVEQNSNTSTPREQAFAQIIGNQSLYSLPPILRNDYMSNTRSSLASTSPHANLIDGSNSNGNGGNNSAKPMRDKGRDYRPPSMQLDTLLNHNL
ncbi:hypothetical protein ZYGM_004041 [Zygosaccharomyces mellis]|uniref:Uncharacterized protein n=1 Tax=Zygosaccharomyces mellis TaxID=42258 RepID=A0A4C2E4I8_9SACH|nr:hypothetical protein ZYGM_004041 [Zygosaccharomyces mellis]